MNLFLNISLIIFSFLVLERSVRLFISSSKKISDAFHLSGYTISFLLIAVATSLPEVVVSVTSALHKKSMLAFGNAIGSNIALLTVISAFPGLFKRGLSTGEIFKTKDIYLAILFTLLMIVLGLDQTLSRFDGIVLIIGYLIYVFSILERDQGPKEKTRRAKSKLITQILIFIASLGLLLLASEAIVQNALQMADILNIKVVFVGLTITALGTSIPELAYVIKLMNKSQQKEILGDIVGSLVANVTLVLGIAAVIRPIVINNTFVSLSSIVFLLVTYLVFYIFTKTRKRIDKTESIILLLMYIAFVVMEFFIKN